MATRTVAAYHNAAVGRNRWFFWDGGFLAVGRGKHVLATHSHHAFQLVVTVGGPVRISHDDGEWVEYNTAIIQPDVRHGFERSDTVAAILLVEPESRVGRCLRRSYRDPIGRMLPARVAAAETAVERFWENQLDPEAASELAIAIGRNFCLAKVPPPPLDPRIATAVKIANELDPRIVRAQDIAARVHLSPGRFAHLFSETVGISFGRYLLWRRLSRAMLIASGSGASLSAAAHAAGFADAAHFTRTFVRMFGEIPSEFLSDGDVFEIDAPCQSGAIEDNQVSQE